MNHAAAIAFAVALGAVCLLGWLAYVVFVTAVPDGTRAVSRTSAGLMMIWSAPAIYLAAWQVLSLRHVWPAVPGAFFTTVLTVVTFYAAWLLGFITLGLLAFPVGMAGIVVISFALRAVAQADAVEGQQVTGVAVHAVTLIFAMLAMLPAAGHLGGDGGRFDHNPVRAALGLGALVLAFAPHAVATAALGPRHLGGRSLAARAGCLIAIIWTGMAAVLSSAHPMSDALVWPFRVASLQARVQAELAIFRSAGDRIMGLPAGDAFQLRVRETTVSGHVPTGWLGSFGWVDRVGHGPHLAISFIPDPRTPATGEIPIRRITVRTRPTLTVIRDFDAISEVRFPSLWSAAGCRPEGTGAETLMACAPILRRSGYAATPRIPLESMTTRVIMSHMSGVPVFLGAGVQGSCGNAEVCNLWFPAREGLAVWVELPEAAVPGWRAAREIAFAVAREAAGIEPDDAPAWISPDGALRLPD